MSKKTVYITALQLLRSLQSACLFALMLCLHDIVLSGYVNMPMMNTIYGYQDSELNHMACDVFED